MVEVECPNCKCIGAYVGFNGVECANKDCKYFTEKQLEIALKEFIQENKEDKKSEFSKKFSEESLPQTDEEWDKLLNDIFDSTFYGWDDGG